MTRQEAYETLTSLISNQNLIKHHLACEAIMKDLCKRLVENPDEITLNKWGEVGLLHDADYEQTRNEPQKHTLVLEQELGDKIDGDVMYAIKSHNFLRNGIVPQSLMDWSIYACDELSGLIIASALVHPDKRLSSVDVDFVQKRFNEPNFAKGADREQIKTCETKLGIPLREFIQIALSAMQGVSDELRL